MTLYMKRDSAAMQMEQMYIEEDQHGFVAPEFRINHEDDNYMVLQKS